MFALAVHAKRSGASKETARDLLRNSPYGRGEREDDIKRILNKIYDDGQEMVSYNDSDNNGDNLLHSVSALSGQYVLNLNKKKDNTEYELKTIHPGIDDLTGGLRRGELYIIAGRPAAGKTTYAINIVSCLCKKNKKVLMLTTEMKHGQVIDRLVSHETQIDGMLIERCHLTGEQLNSIETFAQQTLSTYKLDISDSFIPSIRQVERYVDNVKPDLLVFDHVQHIVGGSNENETRTISTFVRNLKSLAMKYNCAVLLVSQLRRPQTGLNFKTGKRVVAPPNLMDLKGCGTLEEEAAAVLLLHENGEQIDGDNTYFSTVDLAKNRFGPTRMFYFQFAKPVYTFKPIQGGCNEST